MSMLGKIPSNLSLIRKIIIKYQKCMWAKGDLFFRLTSFAAETQTPSPSAQSVFSSPLKHGSTMF
jgi:hypothetical protein